MDQPFLFNLIDSTIDKIFSLAVRYKIPLKVNKETIKSQVRDVAFSDDHALDLDAILMRIQAENADPVKRAQFKNELYKIMQDIVNLLKKYGDGVNSRAIIQTLANNICISEKGEAMITTCPNCKIEFENDGSGICPMCKHQCQPLNANVNSLGAIPSGRLVGKTKSLTREVLETCNVAWAGSE